jgi:hypothetical protein
MTDHILLPHLRLPQSGVPGPRIYIPQKEGGPVLPPWRRVRITPLQPSDPQEAMKWKPSVRGYVQILLLLKSEFILNIIQKLISYLTGNTIHLCHVGQPVNAVQIIKPCLSENHKIQKYTERVE